MTSDKQAITAYISIELAGQVKSAARLKRITTSEYLRRLLERHFKVEPTEMPRRGRPPKEPVESTELSA